MKAEYSDSSPLVDGREVLQACFDNILGRNPLVFAIGEDVGKIGDVNQGFAGLQEKYGELRVTDTGIRECTIIGQGIGAALRGLRPIAEIQYLDYFIYALPTLSDDLACLQYRTKGGQKAPLIIRTRGHRLEGRMARRLTDRHAAAQPPRNIYHHTPQHDPGRWFLQHHAPV